MFSMLRRPRIYLSKVEQERTYSHRLWIPS